MTPAELTSLFDGLNTWASGGQRAPHKPLLVLFALARWARGETKEIAFTAAEADLTSLLKEFGPPRRSHHPEAAMPALRHASEGHPLQFVFGEDDPLLRPP